MKSSTGTITGINGNMITVAFEGRITQNEVGYAINQDEKLKAEVIRIQRDRVFLQVFESTKNLKVGDRVEFTGELLSVQLAPAFWDRYMTGFRILCPNWLKNTDFSFRGA
jgi:V/A-type H+/Na+-transporting ATPase subunit A